MASLTHWTWIWVNSKRLWRTGKPGMLQSMGLQELDTIEQLNNNNKSLNLIISSKTLNLQTSRKPFVKWVFNCIELPLHQNLIYWPSPTTSLEQSPRAIWGDSSRAAVLIFPQIKLNLQLSSCASFLVQSYGNQQSKPECTSFLHPNSTRNQNFGTSSVPLHPSDTVGNAGELGRVSPGSHISHNVWDCEFYLVVEQVICPFPVGEILGGVQVKYTGHTHSWSRHWVGLGWKIQRTSHLVKRYRLRGYNGIPPSGDVLGMEGAQLKKNWGILGAEYAEDWKMLRSLYCRGLSGLGGMVR